MSEQGSGAGGDQRPSYGERAEFGAENVCYRHRDRHSFTLCQRCGQTLCAQCQVQAPVGVLCAECVAVMQPSVAARSARGVRTGWRSLVLSEAPVTYSILAVSVLVFVAQLLTSFFGGDAVTRALLYSPLYSLPDAVLPSGLAFEPWRMFTVMFTHSTGFLLHIVFNMFALVMFGPALEKMVGRAQFALLYVLAGFGGSLGVMLWVYVEPGTLWSSTVGASGAIFGVMGAMLVGLKHSQVDVRSLAVLIAINLGIGFLPGASVSWQAHLGGLCVGAVVMVALVRFAGPRRRALRVSALLVISVVLVAVSLSYWVFLPDLYAAVGG